MEGVVIAMLVAFPLAGLAIRRRIALILPLVGWPLFYVGLTHDWWGHGTGDAWQFVAAMLTLIGLGSTALAVSFGRAFVRRPRGGSANAPRAHRRDPPPGASFAACASVRE
jgi:hypothetical protein